MPDIEGGKPNLLDYSATQSPLRIEFEKWLDSDPQPDAPETLTLFWDGQEVGSRQWTTPIADDELYLLLEQQHLLVDGTHLLEYRVRLHTGNTSASAPFPITLDRTQPVLADDSALLFDEAVISKGVTDAYLQDHGDRLPATVPAWRDVEVGDTLVWYWGTTAGSRDEAGRRTLTLADLGLPLLIHVPGALIRAAGDGMRYAHYTVQDRAETPEQRAFPSVLQVSATPIPPDFGAPYLKETGNTGGSSTLNPIQASNGATLVIKPTVHFEDNDSVVIHWDDPTAHGEYHSPVDASAAPREYRIPRANVAMKLASQLALYYVVTRRGTRYESTRHNLTVSPPTNMPIPQCDKIIATKLSLSGIGSGATFTLTAWLLKDTSQFVTMYVCPAGDRDPEQRVMIGEAVPVPSITGGMTVGMLMRADLEVFPLLMHLEINAQLSPGNLENWIKFPHLPFQLVP